MPTKTRQPAETVSIACRVPIATRQQLVDAIDGVKICTITDAVIEAAKQLATHKPTKKLPQAGLTPNQ